MRNQYLFVRNTQAALLILIAIFIFYAQVVRPQPYMFKTYLFVKSINKKPQLHTIEFDANSNDWRNECFIQNRKEHITDVISLVTTCAAIGKIVERRNFAAIETLSYDLDMDDENERCHFHEKGKLFKVLLRQGDDIEQMLWGTELDYYNYYINNFIGSVIVNKNITEIQYKYMVLDECVNALTDRMIDLYHKLLDPTIVSLLHKYISSDEWIAIRRKINLSFIFFLMSTEMSEFYVTDQVNPYEECSYEPHADHSNEISPAVTSNTMCTSVLSTASAIDTTPAIPSSCNNEIDTRDVETHVKVHHDDLHVGEILLGITTYYFYETMEAIHEALGPLPNSLFQQVVVVDDGSSVEDRMAMQTKYPHFKYIWKHPDEKGHAKSMNILVHEFLNYAQSRVPTKVYFMYLEDDWMLMKAFVVSDEAIESFEQLHHLYRQHYSTLSNNDGNANSVSVNQGYEPITDYGYINNTITHPFREALIAAMHILRSGRAHQILFNDQGSRKTVTGSSDMDIRSVGKHGWPRRHSIRTDISTTSTSLSNRKQAEDDTKYSPTIDIPYRLHEYMPVRKYGVVKTDNSLDDIGPWWPGLSFNPGLWDLETINRRLNRCIKSTADIAGIDLNTNEDKFRHCADERTITNSTTCQNNSHSDKIYFKKIFNETAGYFETRYSLTSYAANLTMAYFPTVFFNHIGHQSAYTVNNINR